MPDAYRDDLAFIHDAGYGLPAENAARTLLDELRRRKQDRGLVVDLGCGSGILSAAVAAAGYDVVGVDLSPAMIDIARRRVPGGRFEIGSVLDAGIPPCVAVTAVGEIFNYLFDPRNTDARLAKLLRRVHRALRPGGVLLFDVATPGRVPGGRLRYGRAEWDWAVVTDSIEDAKQGTLTREITTFRKIGDLYRRDAEAHRLRLYRKPDVVRMLRKVGFSVRSLRGYGPFTFPPGWAGFLARKAGRSA